MDRQAADNFAAAGGKKTADPAAAYEYHRLLPPELLQHPQPPTAVDPAELHFLLSGEPPHPDLHKTYVATAGSLTQAGEGQTVVNLDLEYFVNHPAPSLESLKNQIRPEQQDLDQIALLLNTPP